MLRVTRIALFSAAIGVLGVSGAGAVEPDAPQKLISRMDAVGIKLHEALAAKFKPRKRKKKNDQGTLVEFYAGRDDKPVWITEKGLNERALKAIAEIKQAKKYELDPNAFDVPNQAELTAAGELSSGALAKAELQMSYAILKYAKYAGGGRINVSSLSKYLDRHPQIPDPVRLMTDLSESDDPGRALAALHPTHPQFKLLLAALKRSRTAVPEKVIEIPEGPTLRIGDRHEQVELLRKRLKVKLPEASDGGEVDPLVFDKVLEDAVKEFQISKGLQDDGIVGSGTRGVLNVKPADKTKTLLVNVERWRWMPRDLGRMNIQVNIPEFKFRVKVNGKVIHEERNIIGKLTNQTPVFSDVMETVVLNPYWYPTQNIIRNEILPGARKSGRFVSKNGFEVLSTSGTPVDPESVNWYAAGPRDFSFRQPPGASNALGEVKFLFPNKHAVYLHDTPAKNLFNSPVRAFSHGCMRIRNPRRLAEIILGNEGWSRASVHDRINQRENQHYSLKNKFPVHITYFTAWANPDGSINYYSDIYKHDEKVYAALHGLPVPRDPIDPVAVRARELERNLPTGDEPLIRERSRGGLFDNLFNLN